MSQTIFWQRLEGLAVLLISTILYFSSSNGWLLFALLLFVPDLSMIGYAFGNKPGQTIYNVVHTYAFPLLLALLSYQIDQPLLLAISLIWLAHIGMDRAIGYGLKEATGFKYTHLGLLGGA